MFSFFTVGVPSEDDSHARSDRYAAPVVVASAPVAAVSRTSRTSDTSSPASSSVEVGTFTCCSTIFLSTVVVESDGAGSRTSAYGLSAETFDDHVAPEPSLTARVRSVPVTTVSSAATLSDSRSKPVASRLAFGTVTSTAPVSPVQVNRVTGVAGTLPPLLAGVQCGTCDDASVEQAGAAAGIVRPVRLAHGCAVARPEVRTSELVDSNDVSVERAEEGAVVTVRTSALPTTSGRVPEPSNIGRNCFSAPSVSRNQPAMYAVPRSYWASADRRIDVAATAGTGPQVWLVDVAPQSSLTPAGNFPGVQTVLKKLWFAPMTQVPARSASSSNA